MVLQYLLFVFDAFHLLCREQTSHGLPPAEKLSVEISETDEIKPIGVVENVVDGVYVTKVITVSPGLQQAIALFSPLHE